MHRSLPIGWPFLSSCFCFWLCAMVAGATPDPYSTAEQIDRMLLEESIGQNDASKQRFAPTAGDETFLRRTFLDLIGRPPTPDEVLAFRSNPDPQKRRELVQCLLSNPDFGKNWGKYWRDVVMYRRSEQRAFVIAGHHLSDFVARELNENRPWSLSVSEMITASGFTNDHGQGGFITAQGGLPENIASEVSRVFLGIQIECAQCHDHPNGGWKRQQFHHFAAFFSRVGAQLHREKLVFQVTTVDREILRRPAGNARFYGTPEHYMPDMDDPLAKGTLMEPVFFLTGQKLPKGTTDAARRATVARWITTRENPQFAKAFVNRIWSELIGRGFCEPVDDMGPHAAYTAPRTFDYVCQSFVESGYDVKWFFTTVMATTAYQRESRSAGSTDEARFLANCMQRLRAEQLLDSLISVLNLEADIQDPPAAARPVERRAHVRFLFNEVFGFDPGISRDNVVVTIPQSLLLINSPFVNNAISARRTEALGGVLARNKDDQGAVVELYLKALGRAPSDSEVKTCLDYIQDVNNRNEAFEDIFWTLINSTQFSYRM